MSPPLTGREGPYAYVKGNVCVAGRYNTGLEHGSSGDVKNRLFADVLAQCAKRADVIVTQGLTVGKSNVVWDLVRGLVPGARVIFAYLDTSYEQCLENIYERRARSKIKRTKSLKENAVRQDWRANCSQRERFIREGKLVRDIRHGPHSLGDLEQLICAEGGELG